MKRRLATAALCLLLGACATAPRERPAHFWSGRIGLQVHSDPPQSLHASFELQGNPQAGELTLLNPIGGILARLSWNAQQATLERGNERWSQPRAEQLTQQLVQTPLPVQVIFDWLEGRAVTHADWQVDLSERAQGRIVARRTGAAPEVQMRIVLDQ